jgi:hypothetical protein
MLLTLRIAIIQCYTDHATEEWHKLYAAVIRYRRFVVKQIQCLEKLISLDVATGSVNTCHLKGQNILHSAVCYGRQFKLNSRPNGKNTSVSGNANETPS